MIDSCPISDNDCSKRLENFDFEYRAEMSSELFFKNEICKTGCSCSNFWEANEDSCRAVKLLI